MEEYMALAKEVMLMEAKGIEAVADSLDNTFIEIIHQILACQGRIVMTGIGKSGIISRKIAATLASTGTPSFFMHPGEAAHGDLGMVTKEDIVFMISNSGESDELLRLIPSLKRIQCRIFLMTMREDSSLAKLSDTVLLLPLLTEADSNRLAPTVSTTAMLVVGDAIAMVLLRKRSFERENFALFHPAGSLGKKLIVKVKDIMKKDKETPVITADFTVRQAIFEISDKGLGATIVVDSFEKKNIVGIVTDGDIRRIVQNKNEIWDLKVQEIMTEEPISIREDNLATEALNVMEEKKVSVLPVINTENKVIGLLHIHHIIKEGIV